MRHLLIVIHRWLGALLCVFMAAWFASGAVLIYVPFPALSAADRLDRASVVDTSLVRLAPIDAIRISDVRQTIDRLRLLSRGGRPLYFVQARGQPATAIWADDGSAARLQDKGDAGEIASRFSGESVLTVEGPIDYDQWVVHQGFDRERPYYRVQLSDPAKTVVYVSQATGEVLQRTTRTQRVWNYAGAVVHWIYPTLLRKHWAAWDQLVWWLSLASIALALIGAVLGIDHMRRSWRARRGRISWYRGWMKWHHIMGLGVFVLVLTWIFSGWLSMDHGRLFSMPDPTSQQIDRFRGIRIEQAAQNVSPQAIRRLGSFSEMEIKAVAAKPLVIAHSQTGRRMFSADSGEQFPGAVLPAALIAAAVQAGWPQFSVLDVAIPAVNDVYRQVRQSELPTTTVRVILDDPDASWVHVDAASGDIVSVMDRSRRTYRWLYHGLHSLDFPGLTARRPLWDIVILSLLACGFVFSVTGVFLGTRRLKRSLTKSGNAIPKKGGAPNSVRTCPNEDGEGAK